MVFFMALLIPTPEDSHWISKKRKKVEMPFVVTIHVDGMQALCIFPAYEREWNSPNKKKPLLFRSGFQV